MKYTLVVMFAIGSAAGQRPPLTLTHESCVMCHTASYGLFRYKGADVSPVGSWTGSMMSFSSLDPYWRAKVSAEVAARPQIREVIESECVTCHAPLFSAEAHAKNEAVTLETAASDARGVDGVSCVACHKASPEGLGTRSRMNGHLGITRDPSVYGPYPDPFPRPMWMHTGFVPRYGEHIESSALCATCHNLYTPILDEDLTKVGEFPEQVPFSEWIVSGYPEEGVTCQTCHVEEVNLSTAISSHPSWLGERKPVWDHRVAGGNTSMLALMRDSRDVLAIDASESIEASIDRTREQLADRTLDLDVTVETREDSVDILVTLTNLTGHKFPTGYPERRAWIHVRLVNDAGEVLFENGTPDSSGRVAGDDRDLVLTHQDILREADGVQVYEVVPADREGNRTRRLLSATSILKDNRIPPQGFDPDRHPLGKDVAIVGSAARDTNFDPSLGQDRVTYRAHRPGQHATLDVSVYYQSVPPPVLDDFRQFNTSDVQRFLGLVDRFGIPPYERIAHYTATLAR